MGDGSKEARCLVIYNACRLRRFASHACGAEYEPTAAEGGAGDGSDEARCLVACNAGELLTIVFLV